MRCDWVSFPLDRATFWGALCALTLMGCAGAPPPEPRAIEDANDTGRTVDARSGAETEVLRAVPTLPVRQPRRIAGLVVTADSAYSAASGRTCRALSINPAANKPSQGSTQRLACTSGDAWFFVPDVFGETDETEASN